MSKSIFGVIVINGEVDLDQDKVSVEIKKKSCSKDA